MTRGPFADCGGRITQAVERAQGVINAQAAQITALQSLAPMIPTDVYPLYDKVNKLILALQS